MDKLFIVFCNFLFIFKIVKRHRAFRIWRSKNLYYYYYLLFIINTARFDSFYLLQAISDVSCKDPNIFFDGKVPLRICFSSMIQVIDSYRFFQCSLDKLPKTFNLPVKKGMFPHEFNVPENQDYVGVIPPSHFFGTKFMKKEKFKEFEEWYLEWGRKYLNQEIGDWDFQKELIKLVDSLESYV